MLAINTKNGAIFSIPFIPMDEKEAVQVATNLDELIDLAKKNPN